MSRAARWSALLGPGFRVAATCLLATVWTACAEPDEGIGLPADARPVSPGVVDDEVLAAEVDALALAFVERHPVPGIAITVVTDDVRVSAGYGWADLETARPLRAETPVLLSSVSKTFVGVAAMQAVEEGVLELDQPLASVVGFAVDNPHVADDEATVRHALTHNTGIEDSDEYEDAYADGDPTVALDEFLAGYLDPNGEYWRPGNWAERAPGEAFSYTNVGIALAAVAVAGATGEDFDTWVHTRILAPLDMGDTAYFLRDLAQPPAVPYEPAAGGRFEPWTQYGFPTYPDGLLRSSATDLARYLDAIISPSDDGILSVAGVDALLLVDVDAGTDEDGQAIAWSHRVVQGRALFGHDGSDDGSTTELWVDRQAGVGVAVLLNASASEATEEALIELVSALMDAAD